MSYKDILFPHLGIHFHEVGSYISIGGFRIMYYGIIIASAFLLGMLIARRYAKSIGQDPELVVDYILAMVIPASLEARAYYVIFSWDRYRNDFSEIINLRHGGLGIVGGVMAAFVVLIIFCRIRQVKIPLMMDIMTMGLLAGQILGRWGNFFNREAFGGYTDNLLAMQIPLEYFQANGRTGDLASGGIMEHLVKAGSGSSTMTAVQVHPTFLYEGLWNLALLILIFLYRKHKKYDGELFSLYMMGYGAGRFMIEGLRTDQLQIGSTGIAATQVVCIFLMAGGLIWEMKERRAGKKSNSTKIKK